MRKKWKLYKILYIVVCIIGIIFLSLLSIKQFLSYSKKEVLNNLNGIQIKTSENEEDYKKETSLSLLMVGDCLIHSAVYSDTQTENGYDFKPMLENVKDYIQSFDLAFYNQESILGGTSIGLSTYPTFNSPFEVGDAFIDAGFDIVSLANNHTLDRGERAIINSKNYWNQHPEIMTAGSYQSQEEREKIDIREKNGITYTMLSYTDTTNGIITPSGKDYLVNRYNKETVEKDIQKVRDQVDLLLVSIHFGEEYTHTPVARQKQIAQELSDMGVDIVIGHHPHVVEPIEFIGNTMVIYSLGNFLSAQRGIEKLTGLMASVEVKKVTTQGKSTITLEQPKAELVYTASTTVGGERTNFKLYRYQDLTEEILPNYQQYQEKYLNIVTQGNSNIGRDENGNT